MSAPLTPERVAGLFRSLENRIGEAVELRRALHADPRLSGQEDDTTAVVVDLPAPGGA